jgi:hypothetical protein
MPPSPPTVSEPHYMHRLPAGRPPLLNVATSNLPPTSHLLVRYQPPPHLLSLLTKSRDAQRCGSWMERRCFSSKSGKSGSVPSSCFFFKPLDIKDQSCKSNPLFCIFMTSSASDLGTEIKIGAYDTDVFVHLKIMRRN